VTALTKGRGQAGIVVLLSACSELRGLLRQRLASLPRRRPFRRPRSDISCSDDYLPCVTRDTTGADEIHAAHFGKHAAGIGGFNLRLKVGLSRPSSAMCSASALFKCCRCWVVQFPCKPIKISLLYCARARFVTIGDADKQGGQEPRVMNRGEPARNCSLLFPADQGIPRGFVRFLAWVSAPAGLDELPPRLQMGKRTQPPNPS
jgi:hypothetical protein